MLHLEMVNSTTQIALTTESTGKEHLQSKMRPTEVTALLILCYITLSVGMAINGLFLVVFARSKRLFRHPTNKLIFSLLISDLLIEAGFAVTISIHCETVAHKVAYVLKVFAMTVTVLNLCMIWIDRLITIKMSFSRRRMISNSTVIRLLIISWSVGVLLAVTSLVMFLAKVEKYVFVKWRYVLSVMTFLGFLVLTIANIIIFCVARGQAHKIRRQATRRPRGHHSWQLKSTYLCTIMVTTFLVAWLPYLIENINVLLNGANKTSHPKDWYKLFGALMISCNTLAHPCLYILLNRDTRTLLARRLRNSIRKMTVTRSMESKKSGSSVVIISMRTVELSSVPQKL